MSRTKAEVLAALEEVRFFGESTWSSLSPPLEKLVEERERALRAELETAPEDNLRSVIRSHAAICKAKGMDERAAYGQDPAMYYSLAICGEAGEMGNKIVKGLRNGNDPDASVRAIESELPDVFIYGFVLAYVLGIDIVKLVNEKVDVVIQRAIDGYYGGKLPNADVRAEKV